MIREIIFLKGEREIYEYRLPNVVITLSWLCEFIYDIEKIIAIFLSNWNGVVFVKVLNSWRYRAQKNKKNKKD